MLDEISFDGRGLVPVVVQDEASAEVLMLAYANRKALEMTLETGEMHFFSRSRDEIWRKGETSGATMAVNQLRYDCDGDAVLAIVAPAGLMSVTCSPSFRTSALVESTLWPTRRATLRASITTRFAAFAAKLGPAANARPTCRFA